jgi:hypothetical protein
MGKQIAGAVLASLLLYGGFLLAHRRLMGERFIRGRPWEPQPMPGCIVMLPGRVARVMHRPRERDVCTCLVFDAVPPEGERLTLGVATNELRVFDRDGRSLGATPLGRTRSVVLVEQAYGLRTLFGSSYTVNADNMHIPTARRHRIRVIFGDHSYAEIVSPAHHNAPRFAEVFGRVRGDVRLRVLDALLSGEPEPVEWVAETLAIPLATLERHLPAMVAEGLVDRSGTEVALTMDGYLDLSYQIAYIAAVSRIVVPPVPKGSFDR